MTQNLTPAERSIRAESAQRVVVKHKGRDHQMTGAGYSRFLDRVAAKVKSRRQGASSNVDASTPPGYNQARTRMFGSRLEDTGLGAQEQALLAAAGWDEPPPSTRQPLTAEDELMARAGWTD